MHNCCSDFAKVLKSVAQLVYLPCIMYTSASKLINNK